MNNSIYVSVSKVSRRSWFFYIIINQNSIIFLNLMTESIKSCERSECVIRMSSLTQRIFCHLIWNSLSSFLIHILFIIPCTNSFICYFRFSTRFHQFFSLLCISAMGVMRLLMFLLLKLNEFWIILISRFFVIVFETLTSICLKKILFFKIAHFV